ncbi:MAG: hypothetical protein ACKVXR_13300 [Planctomycetota bacterium]
MISKRKSWMVATALALTGLAGSSAVALRLSTPGEPRSDAAWAFVANNPKMLARHADAIVVAEAVEIYPGRVATSDGGADLLPFQIVELRVQNVLKGSFPDGRVYVERAGGTEPGTGLNHVIDIDGGEFEAGRKYMLFLNEQPGDTGLYYQVNDQSRYEVVGNRLRAIDPDHDSVQQAFHGRRLVEATTLVSQLVD